MAPTRKPASAPPSNPDSEDARLLAEALADVTPLSDESRQRVILRPAPTCLDHVEHFLIQMAAEKNPELSNVKRLEYRISGVFRTSLGPPSKAARELRRMLAI